MNKGDVLFFVNSQNSPGSSEKSGGFHLSEAAYPYKTITEAGFKVDFVSPEGGIAPFDGVDLDDTVNDWFLNDKAARKKITQTLRPEQITSHDYPAVYIIGSLGAISDIENNGPLQTIAQTIWENQGIVASIGYGYAGLLNVTLSDGSYLIDGKKLAAPGNEPNVADNALSFTTKMLREELEKRGADMVRAEPESDSVITDGRLITGSGTASASAMGQTILKEFKKYLYQVDLR